MDSRKIILLAGALVVAVVTALLARSLVFGGSTPQAVAVGMPAAPIDGPQVLVATRALPIGTILDATALKYQPWPKDLVDGAYFLKDKTDLKKLQGTVVRAAITAGQPVTQGALVKPGDRGFLAAALSPGMRAVTFPVTAQAGVAGFVFPGDRIDLVLTQSVVGGGEGQPLKAAETIMRNMRVLATDQRTDNTVDETGKTVVKTFNSVTVEATPRLAEELAVAQTLGSISLSLRSLADNSNQLEAAIASGAVHVPDGTSPRAEKAMLAQLAGQPQGGRATFSTGADVSHYARGTVPAAPCIGGAQAPLAGSAMGNANGSSAANVAPAPVIAQANCGSGTGPVIRVARGAAVSVVPVGGKN